MELLTVIEALFWMKTVAMVLGIIFNVLVIVVRGNKFVRQKRISSYHFIIVQIALADLIYSSLLAFDIEKHLNNFEWVHSLAACRIIYPLQSMSAGVPNLLMLLLAIERYLGIINSLTHKLRTRSIAFIGIAIWVFSFIAILPPLLSLKIDDRYNACIEEMDLGMNKILTVSYFVVFMAIPLFLSTLFHCHIYHFVRRHTKKISKHVQSKKTPLPHTGSNGTNNNRMDAKGSEASITTKGSTIGVCDTYLLTEQKMPLSNMSSSVGSTCDEHEGLVTKPKKSRRILTVGRKTIHKVCHSGANVCFKIRHRLNVVRHQRKEKTRRLKVQILLSITVVFFIFNLPTHLWHTLNLFIYFDYQTKIYMMFATGLSCMHCFFNGIIYSLMDYKFRNEFRLFFKTLIYGKGNQKTYRGQHHRYSNPSPSLQITHSVTGTC